MKSIPVLDYTSTLTGSALPDLVDANGTVQAGAQTYTLAEGDAPTVMYRYVHVRDLFDESSDLSSR
jgi:hypothetical protein